MFLVRFQSQGVFITMNSNKIKYADFSKEDCEVVYASIIKNKKHISKEKTISFLKELRKIDPSTCRETIRAAELYYYNMKNFFNFSRDEKMFYISQEARQFQLSKLKCCLLVLDSENIEKIIEHSVSIEHFMHKFNLDIKETTSVRIISDYFFGTGHIQAEELAMIIELINENRTFEDLVNGDYELQKIE